MGGLIGVQFLSNIYIDYKYINILCNGVLIVAICCDDETIARDLRIENFAFGRANHQMRRLASTDGGNAENDKRK